MNKSKYSWLLPTTITLAGLTLSYILHRYLYWSPMVLAEDAWLKKLEVHQTYGPFAIRVFQTYATIALAKISGLPLRESFFAIQFTLTFVLGLLFYRFLRMLGQSSGWAAIGLVCLMTAYPILGAHFAPTHTWDDIWSYLFLLLAIMSLLRNRWIHGVIYFTIGCLVREQLITLYPILVFWAVQHRKEILNRSLFVGLVLPVVVLVTYRLLFSTGDDPHRFEMLAFNFESIGRTTDSLIALFISFGSLWVGAAMYALFRDSSSRTAQERFLAWSAVIAVVVTIPLGLSVAMARESRIFFPPFVFIIPIALIQFRAMFRDGTRKHLTLMLVFYLVLTAAAVWTGVEFIPGWFAEFDYEANADFRRLLTGIHLGLSVVILVASLIAFSLGRQSANRSDTPFSAAQDSG